MFWLSPVVASAGGRRLKAMMDESQRSQVDTCLTHLNGLLRRGRELEETLASDSSDPALLTAARHWHEDCGVTINQLSGGSKAHWLFRFFRCALPAVVGHR